MKNGEITTENLPVDIRLNDEWENEIKIELPSKPVSAEINPDLRIADVNWHNCSAFSNDFYRGLVNFFSIFLDLFGF